MDEIEKRIRERAYRIWEEEGRPEGRSAEHWERARFLVGIEENRDAAKLPNPMVEDREKGYTTPPSPIPVEPIEALENQGEFPDRFADQGEKSAGPMRRRREPEAEPVAAQERSENDQPSPATPTAPARGGEASGRRSGSRLSFLSPWRNN
jgi:Protein of unknown function (DUF2934)